MIIKLTSTHINREIYCFTSTMHLFIGVTFLLATAIPTPHSAQAETDLSTVQTAKDPLTFHQSKDHSAKKVEIISPEENGQKASREDQTDGVTNKHSESKNEVPARSNDIDYTKGTQASNRQSEKQEKERSETKTQSLSIDAQMENASVTQADVSEKNQVPELKENELHTATQNVTNITNRTDFSKENESLSINDCIEDQTKEIEQTTDEAVTQTDLPQLKTKPTEPPCPLMWPECTKQNLDNATEDVARELTTFALKLFQTLSPKNTKPNLVVAPISIALGLSHLMLGAGGTTKDEMLKVMYGEVKELQCVHDAIQNLTKHDSLLTANEIFYNKELSLNGHFISQSSRFYGSKGLPLFKDKKKNLKKINSWVSDRTNNLIPELLSELPPDLQLMLINVIYYQGKWISRFDPKHTKKDRFKLSRTSSVDVKMMHSHKYPLQNIRDSYLDAQVARFPLSDNCSLYIFVPMSNAAGALKKMENSLTQEIVTLLMTQLGTIVPRATSVSIPQLNLDSDLELNEVLSLLGLYDLFEYPNFCALSNSTDLAVSDVRQRAVLEVKEEGVKAAIATSINVARTVSVFAAQKPFLFILSSDINRVPILIGRVTDPSQK
ncbi:plasma protease C1 inhibitor [Mixophyes fleayi]|uniref:plasma protease C1 inhibitor n=1 Tax=Mixophyes fleayi TaxID=3061075 RepID=UPI003F4DD562